MSYLTKENFKEELAEKIYSLRSDEREDYMQALSEIIKSDPDLNIYESDETDEEEPKFV